MMEHNIRKLPVGIQSFEQIREDHYLLVDKTEYIYRLVHNGKPYFLGRPRRFGKSLLLSTLKAYREGRKDLFKGLKIEELERDNEKAWEQYPVFYFDFNIDNFKEYSALEGVLDAHMVKWEKKYGIMPENGQSLAIRFKNVIEEAYEQEERKRRCVILVDEYDKPLLETVGNRELVEHNKAVFKGFFSNLKSEDEYIQFVFITGVTKFSKVSIFSDLNNLRDISMTSDFSGICGITEEEIKDNFMPEIEELADEQGISVDECLGMLKTHYDGYHFHQAGKGVYNPFSLLNAFADREFGDYWFESGTPTFLVERLKSMSFDARKFTDGTLYATGTMLKDYRDDNPDIVPLLYQTGYLTLGEYNRERNSFTLCFPNEEVKYGFLNSLLPAYVGNTGGGSGKDIITLTEYMESGDLESVKNVFIALFADITYTSADAVFEHYFQMVFYLVFTLLGKFVECERHTSLGRIDCTVKTKSFIYLFEFKSDSSAKEALKQINDKKYADPYASDKRKLYKIGVNFNSETRQLDGWEAEEGT